MRDAPTITIDGVDGHRYLIRLARNDYVNRWVAYWEVTTLLLNRQITKPAADAAHDWIKSLTLATY